MSAVHVSYMHADYNLSASISRYERVLCSFLPWAILAILAILKVCCIVKGVNEPDVNVTGEQAVAASHQHLPA